MYQIMERSLVVRGSDETDTGRSPDAERVLANKRQLLAGWVLLMDKSLLALDQAVAAAKSSDSAARVAGLTDASIELKVFAEQMKAIRLKQLDRGWSGPWQLSRDTSGTRGPTRQGGDRKPGGQRRGRHAQEKAAEGSPW